MHDNNNCNANTRMSLKCVEQIIKIIFVKISFTQMIKIAQS